MTIRSASDGGAALRRTFVSVAAAFTAAQTSVTASPYFLGALISQRHLTASGAGTLYAIEMAAFAVAMLLVAPRINRLSLRAAVSLGMILIVLGQLGSAFAGSETLLSVLRGGVGLGSGLVSAGATAAGSRSAAPERIYAVATATMTIVFAALYLALAQAGHFRGPVGMFLLLALFTAALIPAVLLLPSPSPVAQISLAAASGPTWRLLLPGLAALAAMLAFNYGALAIWPFTEQIGEHIGLSLDRVALLTAAGNALAALGGIAATWLGTRFGRLVPLTMGLVLQGLGSVAVCHANSALGFLVTYAWYLGMWYFCYAYILAVAAAVDPPGRLAVLTGMGYPVSSALGGLSAGLLVESYSVHSIGWLAVVGCSLALMLLVPLCRWIERPERTAALAADPISDSY
jgi:MFS transporter, DHA1 family, inner membrane transport protein